jgi:hypothetical protein
MMGRPAAAGIDQNQPFSADMANISWWQKLPLELIKWTIGNAPQAGRLQSTPHSISCRLLSWLAQPSRRLMRSSLKIRYGGVFIFPKREHSI